MHCNFEPFLENYNQNTNTPTHAELSINVASEASMIKVNLPPIFCAGREERVRVTSERQEVKHKIRAELTKKSQAKSEIISIMHNVKDRSGVLFVKPQKEGEHLLSITVCGQHIPNSPFLLSVNNRDYYRTTFKQPVQTIDIPHHIAFTFSGDMFVTNTSSHSIHVYDKHGREKKKIGKPGKGNLEFYFLFGIVISGDVLYVADCYNHRIQKFSSDGMFLSIFGSYGSGDGEFYYPRVLAIGPDRMVYVSDGGNNRVVVLSEIGTFVRNIDLSASVRCPWGLALSADGNLHVAGYHSHNYAILTPWGQASQEPWTYSFY